MSTGLWILICLAVLAIGYFAGYFVKSYKMAAQMEITGDLYIRKREVYLSLNKGIDPAKMKDGSFVVLQVTQTDESDIAEKTGAITE